MKKEKTKQEIIEGSKLLCKITTQPTKETAKNYYWYCVKKRYSLESKPFIIVSCLVLISLLLYLFTNGDTIEEKLIFTFTISIEIGIFVVIFYLIDRYRINKAVEKIDENTKNVTTYFRNKGIIGKSEKIIMFNEYEDIKSIDRNKNDIYIFYKNNTANIIRYETLTPKQKKVIDDIQTKLPSKQPIKKPIISPETIEENKKKNRKTLLIIVLISAFIVAILASIVIFSDDEAEVEVDTKSQYIVNKYVDELEELKHVDDDGYRKFKEILDQQKYYANFHSSDYYLSGEDEYTLTIYANYVQEVTLYYEVSDISGYTTCEWGEWYLLNGENYTNIDLSVYPKTEGYSIITITNDLDDKEIKVFVDNIDREIVEFDTTFNNNFVILNEVDEENNLLNSRKTLIKRVDKDHFLNVWRSIGKTKETRNKWYALEDVNNFDKYPCSVWIIKEIDNENRIISIDEMYFEDKPGEIKYDDIKKKTKELTLHFIKDDQGFYEILDNNEEIIATLATDDISGSLSVNKNSIEVYNEPNGEVVKTYKLKNNTLFVNLIRAEKGETWYRIGKDIWVKAQSSIEYFDYSKNKDESDNSEETDEI